jgi:hypothetical protein
MNDLVQGIRVVDSGDDAAGAESSQDRDTEVILDRIRLLFAVIQGVNFRNKKKRGKTIDLFFFLRNTHKRPFLPGCTNTRPAPDVVESPSGPAVLLQTVWSRAGIGQRSGTDLTQGR